MKPVISRKNATVRARSRMSAAQKVCVDWWMSLDAARYDRARSENLTHDDFEFTGPNVPPGMNKKAMLGMIESLIAAFPDWKHQLEVSGVENNTVRSKIIAGGTHRGAWGPPGAPAVPATDKLVRNVDIFDTVVTANQVSHINIVHAGKHSGLVGIYELIGGKMPAPQPAAEIVTAFWHSVDGAHYDQTRTAVLVHDDFVYKGINVPPGMHKTQTLEMMASILAAFPDWKFQPEVLAVENNVVRVKLVPCGTHRGAWGPPGAPPVPPTNKFVHNDPEVVETTVHEGKIICANVISVEKHTGPAGIYTLIGGTMPVVPLAGGAAEVSVQKVCEDWWNAFEASVFTKSHAAKLTHKDFMFTGPNVPPGLDKKAMMDMMASIVEAFPDWGFQREVQGVEGDTVRMRVIASGTHCAPWGLAGTPAIPPTNKHVANDPEIVDTVVKDNMVVGIKIIRAGRHSGPAGIYELIGGEVPAPSVGAAAAVQRVCEEWWRSFDGADFKKSRSARLTHKDFMFTGPNVPPALDKKSMMDMMASIIGAFPDWKFQREVQGVEGNTVRQRIIAGGTHRGPWGLLGTPVIPPTNKHVSNDPGIVDTVVKDNMVVSVKVVRAGRHSGPAGIYEQIGGKLTTTPAERG